jgi:hypothetical protein
MIIIPIGVDCDPTFSLRDNNMRSVSWPFDWVVTYNGVTDIMKDKFANYLPKGTNLVHCNTYFLHNTFQTMQRRIERFLELLNTSTEEIIFLRKGHRKTHHDESLELNVNLKNDLKDAEELDQHLKETYPRLKFKIVLALVCGQCFECNKKYETTSKNIFVYNIATLDRNEEAVKYKKLFESLFLQ